MRIGFPAGGFGFGGTLETINAIAAQ